MSTKKCKKCDGQLEEYAPGFHRCVECDCVFQEMDDGLGSIILVQVGLWSARAALTTLGLVAAALVCR